MDLDQQRSVHVSIQKGLSFPPLIKCKDCCSRGKFHCPFCLPAFFKPITQHSRIKIHLDNHLRSAFYVGEYTIHRCALDCRSLPHYHCLYCTATLINKADFSYHVPSCHQAQMQRVQQKSPGSSTAASLTFDDCLSYGIGSSDESDDSDSTDSDNQESNSSGLQTPTKSLTCDSVWEMEGRWSTDTDSSNCDQTVQTTPQDCDEYYFMSLVKMFKRLSPQKKTEVRMKIERLLFEAEFN